MSRIALVIATGASLVAPLFASPSAGAGSAAHEFAVGGGHLKVAFCAEDVVRVALAEGFRGHAQSVLARFEGE